MTEYILRTTSTRSPDYFTIEHYIGTQYSRITILLLVIADTTAAPVLYIVGQ